MRTRRPLMVTFFALAVVAAAASTHVSTARAAVDPPADAGGANQLVGSQLSVVVVTFHNLFDGTVTSTSVGNSVHAYVTVAGAFGTPTGSVNGSMWANGTCSGAAVDTGTSTALGPNGQVDLKSLSYNPKASGKLSVRVQYSGNATYGARPSACTVIDVAKASASVVLSVHNTSHTDVTAVDYGDQVHPDVLVESRNGLPTGNVTVSWWMNGTCAGTKTGAAGIFSLVSGEADTTFYKDVTDVPGAYSFKAHYEGDAGFKPADSDCVAYSVKKIATLFSSSLHDSQHASPGDIVLVGSQIHPYATLGSFPGSSPTGIVNVQTFMDGTCTAANGGVNVDAAATMELSGAAVSLNEPGTRSWKVKYNGDALYAAKTGPCLAIAWKGQPTAVLSVLDTAHKKVTSVVVGAFLHFKTVMDGAFGVPTGSVGIRQFDNTTCSGQGIKLATSVLVNGTAHDDQHEFKFTKAGKISFVADYGSDPSYVGVDSPCVVLTITTAAASPTPTPKATAAPAATTAADPSVDPGASGTPAISQPPATEAPAVPTAVPTASSGTGGSVTPAPTSAPVPAATTAAGGDTGIIVVLLAGILLLLLVIAFLLWRGRQSGSSARLAGGAR